ncbi:MAG: DVU_1556 family methyltransferase [Dehalobacterium sp.]
MDKKPALYESDFMRRVTGDTIRPGGIAITEKAVLLADLPQKAHVLDVGCGSGMTMEFLANKYAYSVTGIDPSRILIDRALERNSKLNIIMGRGEKLPFADHAFDGVISECSLSVVDDVDLTLTEIGRVLKEKGKLMISDLYIKSDPRKQEVNNPVDGCLKGVITKDNITQTLTKHNFSINFWQDCSKYLTSLLCQMIMNNYSVQEFWSHVMNCDAHHLSCEVKYGYYLLIAEKNYHL